jgi:hypothetical protein
MTNIKLARLGLGALVVLLAGLIPATAEAQTLTRRSSPVAHTSAVLSTFLPAVRCHAGGSHSFEGTGLDGSGLRLTAERTGRGLDTTEHVSLTGTLKFSLDAILSGHVDCTATKLVPIPDLPAVRVGPDFSFDTSGHVSGDFIWSPSIDFRFDVSRHGFTHRVAAFTNHAGVLFTGSGTARLDLFLEAKVGTGVGSAFQAGLTGTVGPEITASASTTGQQVCWSVSGDMAASFDAHVQVWRWLQANKSWSGQFGTFGFPPSCSGATRPPSPPAPARYSVPLSSLCSNSGVQLHAVNGCPYNGTTLVGPTNFAYTILIEDNDESVMPSYWNLIDFPATTCDSIDLTFGMPTDGSQAGDTASIQVTAQTLAPQSASVGYGQFGKLEATLDGHPWSLENAATNTGDKIAINGVASCSTPSGY